MNAEIKRIIDETIDVEGGLVDDPDDPGGVTNHGISLRFAQTIDLDLNKDGITDHRDIELVTPTIAEQLYYSHFLTEPKIDTLPPEIEAQVFDTGVLSGPPRAIIILQEVLDEVRASAPELGMPNLEPDGRIGARTRSAAQKAQAAMRGYLSNALADARERYLRSLAVKNPKLKKYIVAHDGGPGGWIKRARSFRVPV